jgi:hypothetical protein
MIGANFLKQVQGRSKQRPASFLSSETYARAAFGLN